MEEFVPIHKHLILKGKLKDAISEPELAKQLLYRLVQHIGMVPVTDPQAVYIYETGNEGLTGSINLATSHIAFHIWDLKELFMADVYSCKDFDHNEVIKFFGENFGSLVEVDAILIDRETGEITKL